MAPSNSEMIKVYGEVHLIYRINDHSLCYIKQIKTY